MAKANIIDLPKVNHPHLKLHDFSMRNHREVTDLARQMLTECDDTNIDGIIVILSSAAKSGTSVFRAGKLSSKERMSFESAKLHLAMLMDRSK
jgi:hypothetical protein